METFPQYYESTVFWMGGDEYSHRNIITKALQTPEHLQTNISKWTGFAMKMWLVDKHSLLIILLYK